MFEQELIHVKQQALRVARSHILARKASAPRVLDAALAFLKRKHPELWLSEDGAAFIAAIREAEANADYEDKDKVDATFKALAEEYGAVYPETVAASPH